MVSPKQQTALRAQAANLLQFLIACEFNYRLRDDRLSPPERAILNRVHDARRRAKTRLQRRLRLRAA